MKIRKLRAKANMSQHKFAKYLHIPVSKLQQWESGKKQPPVYVIPLIEKSMLYDGLLSRRDLLSKKEIEDIQRSTYVTANEFAISLLFALAKEYSVSLDEAMKILDRIHYWETINDDDACCLWAHYGVADIVAQVKEDYDAILSRDNMNRFFEDQSYTIIDTLMQRKHYSREKAIKLWFGSKTYREILREKLTYTSAMRAYHELALECNNDPDWMQRPFDI